MAHMTLGSETDILCLTYLVYALKTGKGIAKKTLNPNP